MATNLARRIQIKYDSRTEHPKPVTTNKKEMCNITKTLRQFVSKTLPVVFAVVVSGIETIYIFKKLYSKRFS